MNDRTPTVFRVVATVGDITLVFVEGEYYRCYKTGGTFTVKRGLDTPDYLPTDSHIYTFLVNALRLLQ